ncbi:hypothetical protein [Acinetobacter phage vB_AbaM_fThrA]|uniref:Uncharacterized protein n=2 Tax=unclassified bacterial viruses TaxID=12333 RepID=A0AAU8KU78_9VIRU|nr:hypothetical protein [Acinetobacter phage vB_AbaM_fThrA]
MRSESMKVQSLALKHKRFSRIRQNAKCVS